ncbi:ARF guanine-nucleotide exchange factor GNOM [Canna indica]|uniref:ARF guanine-nucleotide exchange factor GNOM n=1 Tax=Canna indica TaxID=4628 RepID=A0AAQ3KJN0_9LILI|nr:ARF guanine-nucleotide exchange factor GNOM [Canna indica]
MGHPGLPDSAISIAKKSPNALEDAGVPTASADLACVICCEVSAVLAVMRRNVRWGGRYASADDDPLLEHPLIRSLKSLRRQVFSCGGARRPWSLIQPTIYLCPFLDVVCSDETSAPITGVALSSIYKILTLDVLDPVSGTGVDTAMHLVVEAVTSCRFEVTDPASEEAVLMKILQVLLAIMRSRASAVLSNQHVCTIVNTCFRVVHQAGTKGELLQRFSRHTMHELIRCIFSHLPDVKADEPPSVKPEMGAVDKDQSFGINQVENGNGTVGSAMTSGETNNVAAPDAPNGEKIMVDPYGVPCMLEIFNFLCSLLNVADQIGRSPATNQIALDEDVPLFALGMINSVIELGGPSIGKHPKLLSLIQDELFRNLMQLGLSMSPLILSMVCSIVLNLYRQLRTELKLQLEAFFSCVILRIAQSRYGATYHQLEVAKEALVDFCRQESFMAEMYANFDSDLSSSNVFEELANLLSKSAFPVNSPLSSMHLLALDGLIAMVEGMANRIGNSPPSSEETPLELEEISPFWTVKCEDYSDPKQWVKFVHRRKHIKRRLMVVADHFNRDPKKGLEFLQGTHLLPENLDPHSVAYFFRYTAGLDKNLLGDFLGNHDDFCVQVLREFACTFDFQGMNLDTALRLFLDTFWLPGESQKIQRVLEAFSERYFEQSPQILVDKDAALVLSYSLIMLNTDQHNVQVKKKMTEEDFIRNNRRINGGSDLPRELLSELYHSICKNEIRTIPEQGSGFQEMYPSRWINLIRKSKNTSPYIVCDSRPFLDRQMFAIMSGPTIAAITIVFDYAEHEEVLSTCVDGILAVAKISAHHHLVDVLDDLVVSLCKFTTLLDSSFIEEPVTIFAEDTKARLAIETVFSIANTYGDCIRNGWRNIVDCILRLHKIGLLPTCVTSDTTDDSEPSPDSAQGKLVPSSLATSQIQIIGTPRKSSGLMGRFSQLLSFDTEEPRIEPNEEQLAAHQRTLQIIQDCHIDSIFMESKFLHSDSLMQIAKALVSAGNPQKVTNSFDDEDTAVFCLELLIAITLNNRDRIGLLWQGVYEHIADIVQSTIMPCALVEKAVFGLLRICQRLLPYKENLADELLRSLQLVLKLDARVADAYCENITQEITRLVKANATHMKSQIGWRIIISLLSITARHPEASEVGFEALLFIMSEGAHISPANYILLIEASRHFAESRVGQIDRSIRALDLMVESMNCLAQWSHETRDAGEEADKISEGIREMWVRLVQGLRKVCLDQREEVRNHALLSLQKCLLGAEGMCLLPSTWLQTFDLSIFSLLDDLLDIVQNRSQKDYRNMEATLLLSMKLLSKVFLQLLQELFGQSSFCKLWSGVISRMEKYMKTKVRGRKSDKLQELIPELLKNILFVMKSKGILAKRGTIDGDNLWELTWLHVNNIAPSLQSEVFTVQEMEQLYSGVQTDHTPRLVAEPSAG